MRQQAINDKSNLKYLDFFIVFVKRANLKSGLSFKNLFIDCKVM